MDWNDVDFVVEIWKKDAIWKKDTRRRILQNSVTPNKPIGEDVKEILGV